MQFSSLLGHAQELLDSIRASSKPADSLMDSFFRSHKYLGSHDRKFIAETTYGTLRHLRKCEFILQHALGETMQDVKKEDGLLLIIVAYLVTVAGQKLTVADLTPKLTSPNLKEQAIKLLARLGDEHTLDGYGSIERLGIQYSYPDWMVKRLVDQYGDNEAELILKNLNEPAPLTIRVNVLKTTIEQCEKELLSQEIQTTRAKFSPHGLQIAKRLNIFSLKSFQDGLFEVQDEGSQILPLLVDPKPNAKVLLARPH